MVTKKRNLLILAGVLSAVVVAWASFYSDMRDAGLLISGNTITATADIVIPDLEHGEERGTVSAVSLTSPTVTIAADGKGVIFLNSNANQTGHVLTGGQKGQKILIVMGTGSNTARFDDNGTSMALGANKTLTEGQGDTLGLICTHVDGDEWSLVSDGNGN